MNIEEQVKANWDKAIGTPKTLDQAIQNALEECKRDGIELDDIQPFILLHVKDFLAQKFQLFMSGSGDAVDTCSTAIWQKVMGIK